jgi:ubiquinone/menaquinone biosynthesis C-methylase UbiE
MPAAPARVPMGWLMAALYEKVTASSEAGSIRGWRTELLTQLTGEVLEVGAGTGKNIPHYPRSVSRLVLTEPDPHMRRRLYRRVRAERPAHTEVLDASLERLPFAAAGFDVVVATLVLCSVPRLDRALAEIRRVLRPGGRLLFIEHVAADDQPGRLKWQRRIEPLWKRVSGNCHLTRRTADAIADAHFDIIELRRESMRTAWTLVRPTIRGVAVKS